MLTARNQMRILVSGSHGLVGKALIASLMSAGHEIVRLVRGKPSGATEIEWHPNQKRSTPQHSKAWALWCISLVKASRAAVGPTRRNARFAIAASKERHC
jgi:nucleoside-diphosphate-sugar epimerase